MDRVGKQIVLSLAYTARNCKLQGQLLTALERTFPNGQMGLFWATKTCIDSSYQGGGRRFSLLTGNFVGKNLPATWSRARGHMGCTDMLTIN
jgi:hypothetical protein